MVNRPFVQFGNIKKWGNPYIMFGAKNKDCLQDRTYEGQFVFNNPKYLKLLVETKNHVDYYIFTTYLEGYKLDKKFDFVPKDGKSFSQIFSCAYHLIDESRYISENILIVKIGDKVVVNKQQFVFTEKLTLEKLD
jgi:hypothetical protein